MSAHKKMLMSAQLPMILAYLDRHTCMGFWGFLDTHKQIRGRGAKHTYGAEGGLKAKARGAGTRFAWTRPLSPGHYSGRPSTPPQCYLPPAPGSGGAPRDL